MTALTLLDEELALLLPDATPLPWLDALETAEQAGALRSSARSLLVRGLAEPGPDGLQPAGDVAAVLAPLGRPGPELRLVVAVAGQHRVPLTVLRPREPGAREGQVLVHDLSEDGVHVLTPVVLAQAGALLQDALDPLGLLSDEPPKGCTGTQASTRLGVVLPGRPVREVAVVAQDGGCWLAGQDGAPDVALTADDLGRLVRALLGELLSPPQGQP